MPTPVEENATRRSPTSLHPSKSASTYVSLSPTRASCAEPQACGRGVICTALPGASGQRQSARLGGQSMISPVVMSMRSWLAMSREAEPHAARVPERCTGLAPATAKARERPAVASSPRCRACHSWCPFRSGPRAVLRCTRRMRARYSGASPWSGRRTGLRRYRSCRSGAPRSHPSGRTRSSSPGGSRTHPTRPCPANGDRSRAENRRITRYSALASSDPEPPPCRGHHLPAADHNHGRRRRRRPAAELAAL